MLYGEHEAFCSKRLNKKPMKCKKLHPRVDQVKYVNTAIKDRRIVVDAEWASDELNQMQKREDVLFGFINREMRMTAADPRIADLEKRLAAVSNASS